MSHVSIHSMMKLSAIFVLVISLIIFSRATFARTDRFSVNYYHPATADGDLMTTMGTEDWGDSRWRLSSFLNYGYRPLEMTLNGSRVQGVVDHLLVAHFGGAYKLAPWWEAEIDIPFIAYNSFLDPSVVSPASSAKLGIGDILIRNRFMILRRDEHIIGLGAVPFFTLPTGNEHHFVADQDPTAGFLVALDANLSKIFYVALNVGVEGRERIVFQDLDISGRFLASGGVGVHMTKYFSTKIDVFAATPLSNMFESSVETPVECFVVFDYRFGESGFKANIGGGLSLVRAAGVPLFRTMAGFTYQARGSR